MSSPTPTPNCIQLSFNSKYYCLGSTRDSEVYENVLKVRMGKTRCYVKRKCLNISAQTEH